MTQLDLFPVRARLPYSRPRILSTMSFAELRPWFARLFGVEVMSAS